MRLLSQTHSSFHGVGGSLSTHSSTISLRRYSLLWPSSSSSIVSFTDSERPFAQLSSGSFRRNTQPSTGTTVHRSLSLSSFLLLQLFSSSLHSLFAPFFFFFLFFVPSGPFSELLRAWTTPELREILYMPGLRNRCCDSRRSNLFANISNARFVTEKRETGYLRGHFRAVSLIRMIYLASRYSVTISRLRV